MLQEVSSNMMPGDIPLKHATTTSKEWQHVTSKSGDSKQRQCLSFRNERYSLTLDNTETIRVMYVVTCQKSTPSLIRTCPSIRFPGDI